VRSGGFFLYLRHEDEGKSPYEIIGLINDDPKYHKRIILGRKVLRTIDDIDAVYASHWPDMLIVAISIGISATKMQKIALKSSII
jgi:FlaA1/EpsC-like NDP-sugar epimerase